MSIYIPTLQSANQMSDKPFSNQTELRVSDELLPFSNGCDSLLLAELW